MSDLANALAPLRNVLANGTLGMLSRVWDQDRFGGLPRRDWPEHVEGLCSFEEKVVFDLLFAARAVAVGDALRVLSGECVEALEEAGVVTREGVRAVNEGFTLSPHFGYYIFTGRSNQPDPNPVYVHLGYDSLSLGDLLMYSPRTASALELCAGSGILSLCLARSSERVVAVEWSEPVRKIAEVNTALAGLDDRLEIRRGDLFEAVRGERFDLIVANPPFSPAPIDRAKDPVAPGGIDGLSVARTILENAPGYLSERGRVFLLLGMLGDERHAYFERELREYANRTACRVQMVDLQTAKPVSKLNIPRYNEEPVALRLRQIQDGASAVGASHYHVGLIAVMLAEKAGFVRTGMRPDREQDWARGIREMRDLRKNAAR